MTVQGDNDTISQADLLALLTNRFGPDPMNWAFVCPSCGDIANGGDFRQALADNPTTRRDGTPSTASDFLGQQCIGRLLGALREKRQDDWKGRGCDWVAFGLFRGPQMVRLPAQPGQESEDGSGRLVPSFRVAEPAAIPA